jgi:NADH-quinone oxidoreductase subunit L
LPAQYLFLIPLLPLSAAGVIALTKRPHRRFAATLAIGAMGLAFLLSCAAFARTLGRPAGAPDFHEVCNFDWFDLGPSALQIGWVLDPLAAIMLMMVTFVGLLIFIYSIGYMAHDENFTRFFCFLSLFAAAMLGLVIANSLLLLFMCWELVGLASYLLIGFWYQKPSAAAAAKKAFITTRIGDVVFLLGIVWLYAQAGTVTFYDHGNGCLENDRLSLLAQATTVGGLAVSTGIGLLIFCGAIGKSGQVPLHVWLPDAMEGPTPVSALIHAATMVAAGVFLVARVYPLMAAMPVAAAGATPELHVSALSVVAWTGAITAVFAACIAIAQTDIKRILAYSTVSQLGFMMIGLGVGGVAVGMFHLITHAFFKALLFLGAGSVIHGCHEEQDIRKMGGVRKFMPVTFATYAVGMMALSGVPLVFSGFWSKDAILEHAHAWPVSQGPFYMAAFGALLTAFYMTRQVCLVFFGNNRAGTGNSHQDSQAHGDHGTAQPHESPRVMTTPLVILAVFAVVLGFIGTPAWPWFQDYLTGESAAAPGIGELFRGEVVYTLLISTVIVAVGIGLGWRLYGAKPPASADEMDVLERVRPDIFGLLRNKFYVDELYEVSVIRFNALWAGFCDSLDYWIWNGAVQAVSYLIVGLAWIARLLDEYAVNLGFDEFCKALAEGGLGFASLQNGRVRNYLRVIGAALVAVLFFLLWGHRTS